MNLRTIGRVAIGSSLTLARLPLDGALALLPGERARATIAVELDRADAAARSLLGAVLGDENLREEAERRRAAADERERALRLHADAAQAAQEADARLKDVRSRAAGRRQEARERAEVGHEEAESRRRRQVRRATEVRNGQLAGRRAAGERARRAAGESADVERLAALEAKSAAIRERQQELAARDEAARLREAAGEVKSERKREG